MIKARGQKLTSDIKQPHLAQQLENLQEYPKGEL